MPYRLSKGTRRLVPGDPYFGTRWATPEEKEIAARALHELETERNVIGFVPAPQQNFAGHKIRVQESANPQWYRTFGAPFWRGPRKFYLRRRRVEKALKRVSVVGIVRRNGYETRLLPMLKGVYAAVGSAH